MSVGLLAPAYLWLKALHLSAVIAWLAGLFYLPRLYVYHCEARPGTVESERFKVMERRLLKQIMNPAMLAAWAFGVLLILTPGVIDWKHDRWWDVKFVAVLALTAFHGKLSGLRREFLEDRNLRPQRYYRIINEIPTVLMLVIVFMVILKPF